MHTFDQRAIVAVHARVVDRKAVRQNVLQVRVADRLGLLGQHGLRLRVVAKQLVQRVLRLVGAWCRDGVGWKRSERERRGFDGQMQSKSSEGGTHKNVEVVKSIAHKRRQI